MTRNRVRLARHSAWNRPWVSMRTEPSHDRYRHTFNFGDFQFAPNWPKVIRLVLLGAEIMPQAQAARSEESSQLAGIYAKMPWLRLRACAFPKSFASVRAINPGNHFLQHVGEHQNRPLGAL